MVHKNSTFQIAAHTDILFIFKDLKTKKQMRRFGYHALTTFDTSNLQEEEEDSWCF